MVVAMTPPSVLPAGALGSLRRYGARTLVDQCQLSRPGARVPDNAGGFTPGTATLTTVPCLYEEAKATGFEMVQGAAVRPIVDRRLYLPYDADVQPTDRVIYPVGGSTSYEILDVPPPTAYDTVRVIKLKKP
jgi:hypothetical protein